MVAPDLVPYCLILMHTYGTDLHDAGVQINIARYLIGHADLSVTAKIYTHTTEKAIQEAAKKQMRFNIYPRTQVRGYFLFMGYRPHRFSSKNSTEERLEKR